MSHRFSHLRQSSVGPGFQLAIGSQPAAPPHLVNRINEKKIELENLKQLRDLSAGLAKQLRELESKLDTLTNGTEGMFLHCSTGEPRGRPVKALMDE
ncbi:hypothetical protein ABW19_dt0202741 [Dactylella cylindrospora]|nr:hypothetical protein ABW19_dt0202741 [Dactylella cylindrospora]